MGIFLDIKKAFDCVSHNILFQKLYLSKRRQICDVNGKLSEVCNIDIGVLQGSTLGPILFLCFINDLPSSNLFYSLLFADDTACLIGHGDLPTLYRLANTELQKIATWFKANKLAVNVKKTKYILFHLKQRKIDTSDLHLIYNDNDIDDDQDQNKITEISRISVKNPDTADKTYKYLGILIDENLSFDFHFEYLSKKLSRALYFL